MDRIGRYEVEARIGAGGFGEVYRARDPDLERTVAIKLFRPADAELARQATSATGDAVQVLRKRFLDEARVVQEQLARAPHVVQVLGFDVLDDGTPYYVMPYYERSLRQEIGRDLTDARAVAEAAPEERPRPVPLARALMLLRQVAVALAAVHGAGIVHRDVKPANLMYDAHGDLVLVDFGIAKVPDSEATRSRTGVGMGTLAYMAPEQRESAKHADARADVYAWGVLAYRLLTGTLPGGFRRPVDLVPEMGEGLSELIVRCLEQRVEDRPADGAVLLTAFDGTLPRAAEMPETSGTQADAEFLSQSIRSELEPLRQRIEALLLDHGEVPAGEWLALEELGGIVDLDRVDVQALVDSEAERLADRVGPIRRFLRRVDARLAEHDGVLSKPVLRALETAAAQIGWDAERVATVVRDRTAGVSNRESEAAAGDSKGRDRTRQGPSGDDDTGAMRRSSGWRGRAAALGVALTLAAGALSPPGQILLSGLTEGLGRSRTSTSAETPTALSPDEEAGVPDAGAAERQGRIQELVRAIEADLAADRLWSPPRNNALLRIGQLAALDEVGAATYRDRVAQALVLRIEAELGTGAAERAAGLLDRLAQAAPQHAQLARLRTALAQLRERQQRSERIGELVTGIDSDVRANRLSTPADDNALQKIEALRPLDEHKADEALQRVLAAYGGLFEGALEAQAVDRAAGFLDRLSELDEDYDRLPGYREQLEALRAGLAEREWQRSARISELVFGIDSDIRANRLAVPAEDNALQKVEVLRRLDEDRAAQAFQRVLAAYGGLFEGAIEAKDPDQAAGFLGRLWELDEDYDRLPDYREQLEALRVEFARRERQRSVRISELVFGIDSDIRANRLSVPAEDNALQKIEALRPLDEGRAAQAFQRVLAAYGALFEGAIEAEDLDRAKGLLSRLSELGGDYDRLPDYRDQLEGLELQFRLRDGPVIPPEVLEQFLRETR
jgi:serine/threonine protein kinase/drug/metabolite transporter superfamily protein YnfA